MKKKDMKKSLKNNKRYEVKSCMINIADTISDDG
jgi:hypothetical protein